VGPNFIILIIIVILLNTIMIKSTIKIMKPKQILNVAVISSKFV